MTLRPVPDIPTPAGAAHTYTWHWNDADIPQAQRSFDLASWDVDGDRIAVDLCGEQWSDASAALEVLVHLRVSAAR